MHNLAANSLIKSLGFGSSNNDWTRWIKHGNRPWAGVHWLSKTSIQTNPPSEIFGWKIGVIKQNLIGLKGKLSGNKILNKKYPFS